MRGEQSEGVPTFGSIGPTDGARVGPDGVLFLWHSAGDAAHYRITLTDEQGDVAWALRTSDTAVALPSEVRLERGRTFYWYVDALLDGARSATTGVRGFVAAP